MYNVKKYTPDWKNIRWKVQTMNDPMDLWEVGEYGFIPW